MKKNLLTLCCMITIVSSAQTVVVSDNFDTYTAGAPLAANSPLWITWTGAPIEDANVDSTQSNSAPNSVYIIGNNGPTDIVLPFPANYTSGVYELTMKVFVVTGKGAYFNLQGSMIPGVEWMLEVYFNNAGGGSVNAGGVGTATFSYTPNQWTDIRVQVDLTGDVAQLYVDGTAIYSWQWSLGSDGLGAPLMWGGVNIFATALAPGDGEFFVDDVVLTDLTVTALNEALSFTGISLFPNPSQGNFELVYFSPNSSVATLQLFNPAGEKIMDYRENLAAGKNSVLVNIPSLPAGMYYLRMVTADQTMGKKLVIN